MENFESQAPAPSELSQVQTECESLRSLMVSILVLMIVVSGTFSLFLWRQVSSTRQDLERMRPQVGMMMNQYQKNFGPAADNMIRKLLEYSKTHPDYALMLNKYGIKPAPAVGSMTPAPAAGSKK